MRKQRLDNWMHIGGLWINTHPRVRLLLIVLAAFLAILSLVFANSMRQRLVDEEYQKMSIWARAVQGFVSPNEEDALTLLSEIIESNSTIPCILTDRNGLILDYNNIDIKKGESKKLYQTLEDFREQYPPIIIEGPPTRYLYYSDSRALQVLGYYPYVLFLYFLFLTGGIIIVIRSMKRMDQDRLWEGLSRETAHQLGTPISSLMAWREYLLATNTDEMVTTEMGKDIHRLEVIADRFQKIGSTPVLGAMSIDEVLSRSIEYMRPRISTQVRLLYSRPDEVEGREVKVLLNESLFAWVIENLVKNAVDAMQGRGEIEISYSLRGDVVSIDVRDTGCGISRGNQGKIFRPGYSTRQRGWGLGLSLAKRIIEGYHHGRIFVLRTVVGQGTIFRIELKMTP